MPTRLLLVLACIVLAAVVGGLAVIGSPASARERRFDATRASDLSEIDRAIRFDDSGAAGLPATLAEIEAHAGSLVDPVTAQPYEYRIIDHNAFELCATFTHASEERAGGWRHGPGRQCFTRTQRARQSGIGAAPR